MSEVYISHQKRLNNMDFVTDFDANNKAEATQIGELRETFHKQGRSTAVLFLAKERFNKRIHTLFVQSELNG